MKKEKDRFYKTIKKCAEEVKKWPKWKQRYIISAEAFQTGKLLEN